MYIVRDATIVDTLKCLFDHVVCRSLNNNLLMTIPFDAFSGLTALEYL